MIDELMIMNYPVTEKLLQLICINISCYQSRASGCGGSASLAHANNNLTGGQLPFN